jgi:hypothetical protein
MGGDEPDEPDFSEVAEANEEASKLAYKMFQEQQAWAKEVRAKNDALLKQVMDVQLPIMQLQLDAGQKAKERYETMYLPKEKELVEELWSYDTPERRAQKQAEAVQDVRRQSEAARANAEAKLSGMGVDPSQIRSGALSRALDIETARTEASASYGAREAVENQGRAFRGQVVNMGKGVPSEQLGYFGQSLQAGNAAVGNQLNNAQVNSAIVGTPAQYMGLQQSALGQWGQAVGGYGNYLNQGGAGANAWMGTAGAIIGGAAGLYFSGGNPAGAMAGASLGGAAGGALGQATA